MDINSLVDMPISLNSKGYILMLVNPGYVFTSLKYIWLFSVSYKKSILDKSFNDKILNIFFEYSWIFFIFFLSICAGIIRLLSKIYFDS